MLCYLIVVGFVEGWCPQLVRCHHGHGVVLPLGACCGLAFQASWRCCSPLPSSCGCLPGRQPPFCTCGPPPKAAVEVTGSDGSRRPHKPWGAFHGPRHPVEAGPPAVWVLRPAALIRQVSCVWAPGRHHSCLSPQVNDHDREMEVTKRAFAEEKRQLEQAFQLEVGVLQGQKAELATLHAESQEVV